MKIFLTLLILFNLLSPALAQTPTEMPATAQPSVEPTPRPKPTPRSRPSAIPEEATPSPIPEATTTPILTNEKNPWLAAGFSLLLPGSGQMYVEERFWPEILITAGMALAIVTFVLIDQQRSASIKLRTVEGQGEKRVADAHWDALTLLLQIAIPSLWIWNAGDAYRRAEKFEEKVTGELDSHTNAYIIEENLVSVTLWQF